MARPWSAITRPLRTIRFRLAVQYLLALVAILVIVCYVVLNRWESYVRGEFDSLLLEEAYTFAEALGPDLESAPEFDLVPRNEPPASPLKFSWLFFEVVADDGRLVRRSGNLPPGVLPPVDRTRRAESPDAPVFKTVTIEPSALPLAQSERIRLVSLHHTVEGGDAYYLTVAGSLYPVNASVRHLRTLFLVTFPFGVLVAAAASWFVAGRALAPIDRIACQAESYTAAHLDQRIALRAGDDEISHLVTVINAMLDRLEMAFRAQERFIADASHELKTPLSVLMAEAQILEQRARKPEEHEQFVSSVQDQLRQLTRLIDSLLTLARADAGFPLSKVEPVSLNDVAIEATQRCEALAQHRMVRLVPKLALPTEDGVEPIVQGDRNLLRTVIENLVRNAIRYSPLEQAVEIEVELNAESATVTVRDNGPGIPPEHIDRVFNRFFQIPRGDQSAQGAGLGLAIAKGVIQLHHGTISVRNRPGGGCEFSVELPLKPHS
jgi:two-component system OmpR family sensor kinase